MNMEGREGRCGKWIEGHLLIPRGHTYPHLIIICHSPVPMALNNRYGRIWTAGAGITKKQHNHLLFVIFQF